jgi:lipoate-protein ligase A
MPLPHQGACYHHGTCYRCRFFKAFALFTSLEREISLKRGGFVQSRVINLSELNSELTTDSIRPSLVHALGEITGIPVHNFVLDPVKLENLEKLASRYRSWGWLYGSPSLSK